MGGRIRIRIKLNLENWDPDPDPHQSEKQVPDPHQSETQDPDPDLHQSDPQHCLQDFPETDRQLFGRFYHRDFVRAVS